MDLIEIEENIRNGKTAQLKKAVKLAVKNELHKAGPAIHEAFLKIMDTPKKWALQVELINALRAIAYKTAIPDLKKIVMEDKPHDMVTIAATTAYVHLAKTSPDDVSLVIELLDKGISVVTGALHSLTLSPGSPDEESANAIFSKTKDINKHPQRIGKEFGLVDPRIYVAMAANNWESGEKEGFLKYCIETAFNINRFGVEVENVQLRVACENSLVGEGTKGVGG